MEFELKVKLLPHFNGISLPKYATDGSAGLDLRAAIIDSISLKPGEKIKIPTGIAISMPTKFMVGLVFARSGLASKYGLNLSNGVGVIDSDYTGEIICPIQNCGDKEYSIHRGDRIAQLVFLPIALANLKIVKELNNTERGQGGFGSTGVV
ncbi:dUTP diphosphatase [Bacillota bacterium LX-D]|nr:dUTP diphosphatase [Bacillota bacterium LX-D]